VEQTVGSKAICPPPHHTKYTPGEGAGLEDFGGGGVVAGVGEGGEEEDGP